MGMDLALHIGTDVIQPAKLVRDLDVLLDQELTMKQHISKIARACFFPTAPSEIGSSSTRSRSNCQFIYATNVFGEIKIKNFISAFITSKLD